MNTLDLRQINSHHNQPKLRDPHGRWIRKLRVSLLDACNYRCYYCMPEKIQFSKFDEFLSPCEIKLICQQFINFGIEHIRLTGGEPTLRPDFKRIVSDLSLLPLKKLGLTSNGFKLSPFLDFLKDTRCQHINISLDTLCPKKFKMITRRDGFKETLSAIIKAKNLGFKVKINTVGLRGTNDDEIENFIHFSKQNDIEIRFLELMRIGTASPIQANQFISSQEIFNEIQKNHNLIKNKDDIDSTSENFHTRDGVKVGFISSVSRPFCQSCSRLRLTAKGQLRACLMSSHGYNLKGISSDKMHSILTKTMALKPIHKITETQENIFQIGG